jgi:hypothetical protein
MAGWKFFINNIQVDEPIGWDGIEFNAIRLESHGIDQPFSTEITWSGTPSRFANGAKILKDFFDSGFINDVIPFRITSDQVIDGNTYDFNGLINMALYSEKNTCDTQGWEITVGILENDFKEVFMARQDTEVDLLTLKDLDQNVIPALGFTDVRLHSQQLYLQGFGKQFEQRSLSFGTPFEPVFPIFYSNSDFKNQFGSTFDTNGSYVNNTNVIFVNNGTGTRTILFSGRAIASIKNKHPSNSYKAYVTLSQYNASGGATGIFTTIFATPFIGPGSTYNLDHVFTQVPISIQEDFRLVYFIALDFNPVGGWDVVFPNTNTLTVEEFSQVNASTCKGLYIFDFLKRLLLIITGNSNALVSDYFSVTNQGLMWNNLITTGLYIRNGQLLDQANPQIQTSYSQFFEDLNRIFNLGWGFEYNESLSIWQIRVEPMEYFYDETVLIGNFEKVSNITQNANVQDLVNSFKLGFTDQWKNIAVSGIFEPHTYRGYSTPNRSRSADTKVLDLRSGILGAGYAIEFSRRLQYLRDDSGSSDRPNDYNLFIIWLNRDVWEFNQYINPIAGTGYQLPEETGTVIFQPGTVSAGSDLAGFTNSPIKEIYNILHTPVRIAARWWKYLGMNTYGLPTSKASLFFESGEYYTTLESSIFNYFFPTANQEITGTVAENTNISEAILQTGLNKYLFKPITLDFSFPQNLCSFIEMANIGTGFIRVTSGGFEFFGFLESATNKPVDPNSGITDFKLILANNIPDYFSGDYFPGDYFTGD